METILSESTIVVTLSHTEKKLNGAFAPVMREELHDTYTAEKWTL